jgi:ectoine hydroxylase-related dioxygenase (phytanoyl-CoA dioxygenase family)
MAVAELQADEASFRRFHTVDLPRRIAAGNGALAFADVERLGAIGLRTPAGSFTYRPDHGSVSVLPGEEEADTVVEMDLESWHGLISDLDTAPGLFYGGRVTVVDGKPLRFVRWEPGLRALFHGVPVFDPDTADLRDRSGAPLDPTRSFVIGDLEADAATARHQFDTAGFLWVTGVFDPSEVAELRADADRLEREARPDDEASWWGRDAGGDRVLTRVLRAASRPRMRALREDPRVKRIVSVVPYPLREDLRTGRDAVTVLWKRPGMTEGLADLPWHRDCGMGGHATNCPAIVMTICLTTGAPEAGELRFLPGSHRGSYPFVDGSDTRAPRGVSVPVTAGDVTIHATDVMHASMAPTSATGPHRISVLMAWVPPEAGHHRGGRHYNDVLLDGDDGQVEHLGQKLGE